MVTCELVTKSDKSKFCRQEMDLAVRLERYFANPALDDLWSIIQTFGPDPKLDVVDELFLDNSKGANLRLDAYLKTHKGEFDREWERRREFCAAVAHAVPSQEVIDTIRDFVGTEKVLEIGAGRGLWAQLLLVAGVNILPTDGAPRLAGFRARPGAQHASIQSLPGAQFTPVLTMSANDAVSALSRRKCLFTCWPSTDMKWMKLLETGNFEKIVYIGEEKGGCTANNTFFRYMEEHYVKEVFPIRRWNGSNDELHLYLRK